MNVDGTAMFMAAATIFITQMADRILSIGEIVTVLLMVTIMSLSSAPVPSASLVLLMVVLSAIDASTQDVSILFAIDWLL